MNSSGLPAFFFIYSSYIGVFSPYLSLWLNFRGFSPYEIGILMSPLQWSRIFGPPFWGWLADYGSAKFKITKIIQFSAFFACMLSIFLFFHWSFLNLFLILCAVSFFLSGQIPIAESLAMRKTKGDMGKYGKLRLWGSVGFIFAVLSGGFLFDTYGIIHIPIALTASLILLFSVSLCLSPEKLIVNNGYKSERKIFDKKTLFFLISSFFMLIAHAPLYTIYSLWLQSHGFSKFEIGLIWTLGVFAEICFFYFQSVFFKRFSVEKFWTICFFISAIRFSLIFFSEGGMTLIIISQLLHALTFAAHHSASMALVTNWFPQKAQARGQSLYTMASYGLGGSLGGIMSGWVWDVFYPEASFLVAIAASIIGGIFALKSINL